MSLGKGVVRGGVVASSVVVAWIAVAGAARADELVLRDGTKLSGEVVRETKDEVEVRLRFGGTTVRKADVASHERKATDGQELAARRRALTAGDAPGRVALAREAALRREPAVAAALAQEALAIDPRSAGAIEILKSLDYKLEREAWVAPDSWYPAHGFVRRDRRWLAREEATWADARAASAAARRMLACAEGRLQLAQRAVGRAILDEGSAHAGAEGAKAELRANDRKVEAAKLELDARERDLWVKEWRATWTGSRRAARDEDAFRDDRDAALDAVKRLSDIGAIERRLGDALGAVLVSRAHGLAARWEIECLKEAIAEVRGRLPELDAAERDARREADLRRERDAKAADRGPDSLSRRP